MRKVLVLLVAFAIVAAIHEGAHALTALAYGEYKAFHVKPYGFEVEYETPVEERQGAKWAVISGAGNLLTCLLGYVLLLRRKWFSRAPSQFLRGSAYWLTLLALLADPLNLSFGPFLYGGDANGIAVGLGVSLFAVQIGSFVVLLLNRELIVQKLFLAYGVQTRHFLFRPLF
ncbi:MAG: hypothetical protein Q8P51_13995 [Ignavibacteria bacterium]|nr:hypothetical protein [Ignavibacteria bacterium]